MIAVEFVYFKGVDRQILPGHCVYLAAVLIFLFISAQTLHCALSWEGQEVELSDVSS